MLFQSFNTGPFKIINPEILRMETWQDSVSRSPSTKQDIGDISVIEKERRWLKEAIIELEECSEEAKKEGIEVPSDIALEKAENVLKCLSEFEKPQPDVYPMKGVDGTEVVVDLQNPDKETSELMVIEDDGTGVLYFQENKKETYKLFKNEEKMVDHLKEIRKHNNKVKVIGCT